MVPHAVGDRHGGEASDSLVAVVLIVWVPCHMGADIVTFCGGRAVHGEVFGQKRGWIGGLVDCRTRQGRNRPAILHQPHDRKKKKRSREWKATYKDAS